MYPVSFRDMTYSILLLSPNHFAMTGAVSCGLLMFQAVFMTLSFFDSMSTAFETVKHEQVLELPEENYVHTSAAD